MLNEIQAIMHEISTKESSIYRGLFGFEGFEILKTKDVSWCFKVTDLYEDVKLFMDYLIYLIIREYGDEKEKILFDHTYISINHTIYKNIFSKGISIEYIPDVIFNDIENCEIFVNELEDLIIINLKLNIYKIDELIKD